MANGQLLIDGVPCPSSIATNVLIVFAEVENEYSLDAKQVSLTLDRAESILSELLLILV
jgi:hypothetical protein